MRDSRWNEERLKAGVGNIQKGGLSPAADIAPAVGHSKDGFAG